MKNNKKKKFFPFLPLVLNLILFLFLGFFLEDTAWMETEVDSFKENTTQTWTEWFGNNYETIATVTIWSILIIIYFHDFDSYHFYDTKEYLKIHIELFRDLQQIKSCMPERQYETILEILNSLYNESDDLTKEEILKNVIETVKIYGKREVPDASYYDILKKYFEEED